VLRCDAVCCGVLRCSPMALMYEVRDVLGVCEYRYVSVLRCVVVCCSALRCVAVRCGVLRWL